MRAAGSYRVTSVIVLTVVYGTIGGHVFSVVGETENGKRRTATPTGRLSGDAVPQEAVRSEESAAVTRKDVEFERVRAVARASGSVRVIVQLDVPNLNALTAASHSAKGPGAVAATDGQLSGAIGNVRGGELAKLAGTPLSINRTYASVPFIALTVSEQALNVLRASPGVLGINEDHLAAPTLDHTVNITGASASWTQGFDGSGWYVAILDTGIRASHNFFAGKNIIQACFSSGEDGEPGAGDCPNGSSTDTTSPDAARHFTTSPTSDHGTHVSGIATGNDPIRVPPLYGIARGADIIAIQVFSQFFGTGDVRSYSSDQIAGLEHVYALRSTHNIASANMSLGGGQYSDEASCDSANAGVKAAIDNLRGAGIATVIASGNDGFCGFISGPGCISTAVAVGNTFDSDVESSGSNYHAPLLELFAPGSSILSSRGASNSNYGSLSGTSMAAPHVAGAWAILKQLAPAADVSTILTALQTTGDPVSGHCGPPPTERRIQIDLAMGEFGIKFSQPPDSTGRDADSNMDSDMAPNVVIADDFVSDGRPIHTVAWWGSNLISNPPIDGWFISFHEPLLTGGAAAPPLGLYFCDSSAVSVTTTPLAACDTHAVLEYAVNLVACCLIQAIADSRPPLLVPAQADGFHEQECYAYDIDIQAVMGYTYTLGGGCAQTPTANSATAPFWGWHTTSVEHGLRPALQSAVTMPGPNRLYGPWALVAPSCSAPNMAFQLSTNAIGSTSDCNDNGIPDQCDTAPDCQPNGRIDQCEIAAGIAEDCNGSTVPDECELPADPDCNNNSILDECDPDCDISLVPDDCEIASDPDCNGNAVLDVCDNNNVGSLSSARTAVLGFVNISGTGTPLNLGDDEATNVTMPFTTAAFGGPTVSVANNGGIGLVPNTGLGAVDNWPLPHVNAFGGNPGMLVYWDDLHETTGNVYHQTVGSTPSRTFIVQWDNLEQFNLADGTLNGDEVTFELQIFESPVGGVLAQYLYSDTNFLNAAFNNGASATVGYQRSATSAIPWSFETAGAVTSGMVISLLVGDLNGNGRPDGCDPTPPQASGSLNRNRALGLSSAAATAGPGPTRALRVTMVELQNPVPPNVALNPPPDFSAYEAGGTCTDPYGCVRWVGPPHTYLESQDTPGMGNYRAARLQCIPHYQDWSAEGVFYITGAEIVPSSTYDVHSFAASCATMEPTCIDFSAPLRLTTARSGDVEVPFCPPTCGSGTGGQPDVIDVAQLVAKVKGLDGALPKSIAQMQPDELELNTNVNVLDIVAVVNAVKLKAYAFGGPCPCPSLMTCGSLAPPAGTPCASDTVCKALPAAGGGGPGAKCVKTCVGGDNHGEPCIDDTHGHCPGGGVCGNGGLTPGLCRDRCGRCN